MLGILFRFVEVDVTEKQTILQSLYKNNAKYYGSVKKMVSYECYEEDKKLLKPKKQGSRTLLRLHRALDFLIKFVQHLHECEDKQTPEIFQMVYDKTLSPHHTWFIRKSVKFASYTVPSREKLLLFIMGSKNKEEMGNWEHEKETFIEIMSKVYERVQNIYKKEDILNLD